MSDNQEDENFQLQEGDEMGNDDEMGDDVEFEASSDEKQDTNYKQESGSEMSYDDQDPDMLKGGTEDQRRRRGKYQRRKRTDHDHEIQFKQEEEDMEERMARMKEMAIDMKRLDLTRHQHQLVKEMAADLINNFEVPECSCVLSRMKDMIRLMMRTRDHKVQFESLVVDDELMDHLNNCKEDLYKQLYFNYRELFQTNLNRRWTKGMIKQISQQIIEDREQYSKVQVKKGKVPREYLWYHATMLLASKLVKESDETWLESSLRAKLKMHHTKLHSLIMQIESIEFTELFKRAFE